MDRLKTKAGKREARIMGDLLNLACALSPENLHCDGEISIAQARAKHGKIMAKWHALEKELGYTVTEEEVYGYHIKNRKTA